jgi:spoIIIJ-associated protein
MSDQPTMQEYVESAQAILGELLRMLEFDDARLETSVSEGQIFFQIVSADAGRIIGRTSQTLDAIQFLLNRLLSRKYEESPYCVVDAEHYRERRREKLLADASQALERVRQTGHPWRMPLLNSMERRIIHQRSRICPTSAPIPKTRIPKAASAWSFPSPKTIGPQRARGGFVPSADVRRRRKADPRPCVFAPDAPHDGAF